MNEPRTYGNTGVTLHHGDCLDVLAELPDASVDAVVCDPPYGLEFMGKDWDSPWKAEGKHWREASRLPGSHSTHPTPRPQNFGTAGLPFQQWCELWAAECLRVLKPGGHMLAFGGTRTYHRLACAVEDAGFEIRDSIAWLYGSGFPKSLDVSKAIDKARNEDRAPVDTVRSWLNQRRIDAGFSHDAVNKHFGHASNGGGSSSAWMTNPTSRALPTWDQWVELKRIFSFGDEMDAEVKRLNDRKGADGDSWHAREVVGMYDQPDPRLQSWAEMQGNERGAAKERRGAPATDAARTWQGWGTALKPAFEPIVVARKPLTGTVAANVLAHGTGALNIDACRIEHGADVNLAAEQRQQSETAGFGSSGMRSGHVQPLYSPAGRWPANVTLDESQAAALDQQSGKAGGGFGVRGRGGETYANGQGFANTLAETGQTVGYGDSGGASRFFYVAKAPTKERPKVDGVAHPTVKPLKLMRWLVRLVTPPGGVVLEPFAGSGATVEACILEGFDCIAIEREADYLPLIEVRIARSTPKEETCSDDASTAMTGNTDPAPSEGGASAPVAPVGPSTSTSPAEMAEDLLALIEEDGEPA